MTPEFAYFLKVNVAFILLYAFYRLFFYKDTFFKLRRTILLAFFGVSLLYPLMNIQDWIREQGLNSRVAIASDNFHQLRASVWARRCGLEAESLGCASWWPLGPGYWAREAVAVVVLEVGSLL